MWAKVESGSVTKIYARPTALTVGDVNYPANIMGMWSASELEAIGIYAIVEDLTNWKDTEYYINTNKVYAFASGTVTSSYGTATAKDLDSLKTRKKQKVNNQAYSNLKNSDWLVVRATEGGTAVPSNWSTYRAVVRTTANSMCTKIDNAADVDALAALYVYNSDDPPTRPIGEFPNEPEI